MIGVRQMDIVAFEAEHLKGLEVNEFVSFIQPDLDNPEYGEFLAKGEAYTGIVDGKVIGCAGFMPLGVNRFHAWALLSKDTRKHMVKIARMGQFVLYNSDMPRVETNVRSDFPQALKFVELLGFLRETPLPMKKFGDDGKDYYLYARVK